MKRLCLWLGAAALLCALFPPAAEAFSRRSFAVLDFWQAEGFTTCLLDTEGEEHVFDGMLDLSALEEYPQSEAIASCRVFYEGDCVLEAELRPAAESAAASNDPRGGSESVLTNGYYALRLDLDAESEAFLTGLTPENAGQVQRELLAARAAGTAVTLTHLDFIDAEKTGTGDGELCWAASCANVLHYTGWSRQAGLNTPDDVFEVYVDAFSNKPGNSIYGFPWFFCGVNAKQGDPGWPQAAETGDYAYGTFAGFLPQYAADAVMQRYMVRENSRQLPEALAELRAGSGAALLIGWASGSGDSYTRGGGHLVSLWGYVREKRTCGFDKADYVALLISDSDSDMNHTERRSAPNRLRMLEMTGAEFAYRSGSVTYDADTWLLHYREGKTGVLEGVYCLRPYDPALPREETTPTAEQIFRDPGADMAAFLHAVDGDPADGSGAFRANIPLTLRWGLRNGGANVWDGSLRPVRAVCAVADSGGTTVFEGESRDYSGSLKAGSTNLWTDELSGGLPEGTYTVTVTVTAENGDAYATNNTVSRGFTVRATPETVRLYYDAGGGTGVMPHAEAERGAAFVLPRCRFTPPEGMAFSHWELNGAAYAPGQSVTPAEDATAAAVFSRIEAADGTLRFAFTSGSAPATLTLAGYDDAGRLTGLTALPAAERGELSLPEGTRWRAFLTQRDSGVPLCPAWDSGEEKP